MPGFLGHISLILISLSLPINRVFPVTHPCIKNLPCNLLSSCTLSCHPSIYVVYIFFNPLNLSRLSKNIAFGLSGFLIDNRSSTNVSSSVLGLSVSRFVVLSFVYFIIGNLNPFSEYNNIGKSTGLPRFISRVNSNSFFVVNTPALMLDIFCSLLAIFLASFGSL